MRAVCCARRKCSADGFTPAVMAHTGLRLLGLRLRQLLELIAGTRDPSDRVEDTLSIGERLPV